MLGKREATVLASKIEPVQATVELIVSPHCHRVGIAGLVPSRQPALRDGCRGRGRSGAFTLLGRGGECPDLSEPQPVNRRQQDRAAAIIAPDGR